MNPDENPSSDLNKNDMDWLNAIMSGFEGTGKKPEKDIHPTERSHLPLGESGMFLLPLQSSFTEEDFKKMQKNIETSAGLLALYARLLGSFHRSLRAQGIPDDLAGELILVYWNTITLMAGIDGEEKESSL